MVLPLILMVLWVVLLLLRVRESFTVIVVQHLICMLLVVRFCRHCRVMLFSIFNGTSMASPHVAGAFAGIRQGKEDAPVGEIKSVLKSVGSNVGVPGALRRGLDITGALKTFGISSPVVESLIPLLLDD